MSVQDNLVKGARVYRLGDHVALSWTGVANSNHYLTPEVARVLGHLLLDYAEDIKVNEFTISRLGTCLTVPNGGYVKE